MDDLDCIWKLEAIQQRLLEAWQEAVSVPSIQQVLEENGLGEPTPRGVGGAGVQAELFAREPEPQLVLARGQKADRKSTRLNSSHRCISYAVFCLKKKNRL